MNELIPQAPGHDPELRTRYGKAGPSAVWILLAVAALVFQSAYDAPYRSLFHDALFDSGHILIFALVTWAALHGSFHWRRTENLRPRLRWFAVGLFVCAIAVASEAAQIVGPRDANLGDLSRDFAGIAIVLVVAWSFRSAGFRRSGLAIATLILVLAFAPLLQTAVAYVARDRAFPSLCRFTGRWEQTFVGVTHGELERCDPPHGLVQSNARVGRVHLYPARPESPESSEPAEHYPGFWIREVHPNWTGFDDLVFDLFSEEEEAFQLVLRVHDAAHDGSYEDRFHRTIPVPPGASRVSVPLAEIESGPRNRNLDLEQVRTLVLFAIDPVDTLSVYIGPMGLARGNQARH